MRLSMPRIDPDNITQFNQSVPELEKTILFWICAAGKTAKLAARVVEEFLEHLPKADSPFLQIKDFSHEEIAVRLKWAGMGCSRAKAKTFLDISNSGIDLQTCSVVELEAIYGIGPKTSRAFILHSRKNQHFAVLDTHILKYINSLGISAPKNTPTGKRYLELERVFLSHIANSNLSPAEMDLEIWRSYRRA